MINNILKNNLIPKSEFVFGVANLEGLINEKFGKYQFGISIGKKLDDNIIDAIKDGPTLEYYNYYNQINKELAEVALKIKSELQKINIDSIIIEPTISSESKDFKKYLKTLTVDVSHKMVATRAGLGWIGKTDLFISEKFGPRLRLVSLLISKKPKIHSIPVEKSKCGKCAICVEKCPAQAANGKPWSIKIHRDVFFNAHKCRDKCEELAMKKLKVNKRICGLCISVCPIGKKRTITPK